MTRQQIRRETDTKAVYDRGTSAVLWTRWQQPTDALCCQTLLNQVVSIIQEDADETDEGGAPERRGDERASTRG